MVQREVPTDAAMPGRSSGLGWPMDADLDSAVDVGTDDHPLPGFGRLRRPRFFRPSYAAAETKTPRTREVHVRQSEQRSLVTDEGGRTGTAVIGGEPPPDARPGAMP